MATDDSMDDEVFETQEDTNKRLTVLENDMKHKDKTPSPTGYRNYRPPSEVLRLGETETIEECVEQLIHKASYNLELCR